MNRQSDIKPERNPSLDIMRAFALMMMAGIHFLRGLLIDYPGTWEGTLRFILESAPIFFFVAFGMTAMRTASGSSRWRRLLELGIISFLHQGYLKEILPFKFDFLIFLWLMLVIINVLRKIFSYGIVRLLLLVGILTINLLIGHEKLGIIGGHPFGPMPWAYFVILGMMIGIQTQSGKNKIELFIFGLISIAGAFFLQLIAPAIGLTRESVLFTKWHPTTSTYLLLWGGIALWVYCLFGYIRFKTHTIPDKYIRTLSVYLLQGTLFHYFTNSFVAKVFHVRGYNTDIVFPVHILIFSLFALLLAIYAAISLTHDIRKLIAENIDEKKLYISGWVVAIAISILAFPLSLYQLTTPLWIFSALGMLYAVFVFMDTGKLSDDS